MTLAFDNETKVDNRHVSHVFDIARGEGMKPVRVVATRFLVEGLWAQSWDDEEAVKAEFDRRKHEYLWAAAQAPDTGKDLREYLIG